MFKITKFTGEEVYINPEMIKFVERGGDTILHLATGERLLIKETPEEIQKNFVKFKQMIYQEGSFILDEDQEHKNEQDAREEVINQF